MALAEAGTFVAIGEELAGGVVLCLAQPNNQSLGEHRALSLLDPKDMTIYM